MPKDEEIEAEANKRSQHQQRCPSCLSTNVSPVPNQNHMGCNICGNVWCGRDFNQNEEQ